MPFTKTQYLFLELFKYGLWRTPLPTQDFENLSAKEWRRIYKLSAQQTCVGVIADAILSLPQNALPPMDFVGELMLRIKQIKTLNEESNNTLSQLSDIYRQEDFPFVLLKGQGVGLCYPDPSLRMSGDIDVFLYREGDYERANHWAESHGCKLLAESLHETLFYFNGVAVENHLYIAHFGRKKYDDRLKQLLKQTIAKNELRTEKVGNAMIRLLPPELNGVYIFQHILYHFALLGVGLRQVSDWMLFLQKKRSEINQQRFMEIARHLDLLKPMQHFASACVRYLGAPPEIFPFPLIDSRYTDVILAECFRAGNFGFNEFENKRFTSELSRKWFKYKRTVAISLRIGGISPEHIASVPWTALLRQTKIFFYNRFSKKK